MPVFTVNKPFILNGANIRPVLDAVKRGDEFVAGYRRGAGGTVITCDDTFPRPSRRGFPFGSVPNFGYQGAIEMRYDPALSRLRADIYENPHPDTEVISSLKAALKENGFGHGEEIFQRYDGFVFAYDDVYEVPGLELPMELTRITAKTFIDYAVRSAHSQQRFSYLKGFTFPVETAPAFDFTFEAAENGPRFVIGEAGRSTISGSMRLQSISAFEIKPQNDVRVKDLTVACDIKTPKIEQPAEEAFSFLRPMGEHFYRQFCGYPLNGYDIYSSGPKVDRDWAEWVTKNRKNKTSPPAFFDQHSVNLQIRAWGECKFDGGG